MILLSFFLIIIFNLNPEQVQSEVCWFFPVWNKVLHSTYSEKLGEGSCCKSYVLGRGSGVAKILFLYFQEGHSSLGLKCQQHQKTAACPCFLIKNQLTQHGTSHPGRKGNTLFSEQFVQPPLLMHTNQACLKAIIYNFSGR